MSGDVHLDNGTVVPMTVQTKRTSKTLLEIENASRKIQGWWAGVKNRKLFCVLKSAICCAENSLTHEILRKLIPREADLLQDIALRPKIRFRLKGDGGFPPTIVFKIFTECRSIKYISGRNTIRPKSEASEDARKQMGNRIYFDQLLHDACQHQQLEITDVIDVATVKDYMKYKSGLDESPAYLGGRENYWRNLTIDVLPRHTRMYNIVEFLTDTSPIGMQRLSIEKLQDLSAPPSQEKLKNVRTVSSSLSSHHSKKLQDVPQGLHKEHRTVASKENRKRIAKKRAEKMRMNYSSSPSNQDTANDSRQELHHTSPVQTDQPAADYDDTLAAIELYEWTKELSFEELN